jgi:uncharacterized protein YqjF (DUF2071 family)
MRMRWTDLLFAHWPVPVEALRPLIPTDLEIDTFEGQAYLGIIPFRMGDVAPRGLPAPPMAGTFLEVNVRTYVRHGDRAGVWFLSLDASSRLAVEGARAGFHLPYFHAVMSLVHDGPAVAYGSRRVDPRGRPATMAARYEPTGPVELAADGSLEAWLTDRWRLFAVEPSGAIVRGEIRHAPWPLQPATADLDVVSLAAAHGLTLPRIAPHLRYAGRVDVRAWWPRPA